METRTSQETSAESTRSSSRWGRPQSADQRPCPSRESGTGPRSSRSEQTEGEEPDRAGHRLAVVKPMRAGESKQPEQVADELAVCVGRSVHVGRDLTRRRPAPQLQRPHSIVTGWPRCRMNGSPSSARDQCHRAPVTDSLKIHCSEGLEDVDRSEHALNARPSTCRQPRLGWHLTDDSTGLEDDRRKWTFPVTLDLPRIGGNTSLCSLPERTGALRAPLHTNFKLGADGEYLALVQPDGLTTPPSLPRPMRVSSGMSLSALAGATVNRVGCPERHRTFHVPCRWRSRFSWTAAGFNDGAWLSGSTVWATTPAKRIPTRHPMPPGFWPPIRRSTGG
jgi:hypothetical protein